MRLWFRFVGALAATPISTGRLSGRSEQVKLAGFAAFLCPY